MAPSALLASILTSLHLAAGPAHTQEGPPDPERPRIVLPEHRTIIREGEEVEGEPRQPFDVVHEEALVHADIRGRSDHVLLDLHGTPDTGFGAVWHDSRNGRLGLYMAFLDTSGRRLGPEQPVFSGSPALKSYESSLALSGDRSGGLAWYPQERKSQRLRLRFFDAKGAFRGPELSLGGGRASVPDRYPRLVLRPDGSGILVTVQGRQVNLRELEASGSQPGHAVALNPSGPWANGEPFLAVSEGGDSICGWNSDGGPAFRARTALGERGAYGANGGRLLGLASDRHREGWWCLMRTYAGLVLRHLTLRGEPDGSDIPLDAEDTLLATLAGWSNGPAVATVPRGSLDGPVERSVRVQLLGPDGYPGSAGEDLEWETRGRVLTAPRVARSGPRLMVAWTERRGPNIDIYYRVLREGVDPGDTRRLNTDETSANQRQVRVSSAGGDLSAVVWNDDRDGLPRAYARLVDAEGEFRTPEIRVPTPPVLAAPPDDGRRGGRRVGFCAQPNVALAEDGRFLVTWKERIRGGWTVRAQAFGADGAPAGEDVAVDGEEFTTAAWDSAAIALRGGRGFVLFWVREDSGLLARRLTASGRLADDPIRVAGSPYVGNPSAVLLDDNRLVVAWDRTRNEVRRDLRGRILHEDGRVLGEALRFAPMRSGYDWNPALAPSEAHGFLLVWVRGRDLQRDVVARFFDRDGEPVGLPVAVTPHDGAQEAPAVVRLADGSWAVSWQEEVQGIPSANLRRLHANRRELGPKISLHRRETAAFVESYLGPDLAALGDGLIGTWTDSRRAKGYDVYYRILGDAFDGPRLR